MLKRSCAKNQAEIMGAQQYITMLLDSRLMTKVYDAP